MKINKKFKAVFTTFFLLISLTLTVDAQVPVVVTSHWLKENLGKPDLVILHVSTVIKDYHNGHIPGALFLWPGSLSVSNEKESTVPADLKQIRKVLENLGVSNRSHIVLCGIYGNLTPVCRVFVTLEHIGLADRISILEGGFDEWKNSGGEASVGSVSPRKGKLTITVQNNLVDADWVASNLSNKDYLVIDARPKQYYNGETGVPRQGHIPGAKSLPSTDCYDGKTFQFYPESRLAEIFASLEIPEGAIPVFHCFIGNSASVNYVAARIAGYKPLLFDGSMEAWGSRFDLPVEK
jgi:thiosulfate/3-mercaptopyruvate sulfurtransferase